MELIKKNFKFILLALLTMGLLILGGKMYVSKLLDAMWTQTVQDVLEVSNQGAHAFEVYLQKDMESLHNLTKNLSQLDSTDYEGINRNVDLFNESVNNYTVIDLEKGTLYANRIIGSMLMTSDKLQIYKDLPGDKGYREPYINEYTKESTLGCYERFTFADGAPGIVQKGQLISKVSGEFSLSFFEGSGYSYIVNKNGDFILRSENSKADLTDDNIFEFIDSEYNDPAEVAEFKNMLINDSKGARVFQADGQTRVIAFVPVENTDGWSLVSIVPNDAIVHFTGEMLASTRFFTFAFALWLLIMAFIVFIVVLTGKNDKEKEAEIKYREQLFSLLASSTDDVFVMLSANDFKTEYVSPNVEKVFGVDYEEAKKDIRALDKVSFDDGKQLFEVLAQLRPEGSLSREGTMEHGETGEVRRFVENIYRVSIEKNHKYVLVISDRTDELNSKAVLEEALQIARVANEAKSTFLSNMSHDIRTPMNAIIGFATLLQRDAASPEKVKEYTRKIMASSQHLLGLINDVLDMSKIESGKTTLNITEFSLAELMEELTSIIRTQANAKRQTLDVAVNGVTYEYLLGDKLRVNQIFINILSNAVKYTPVGGNIKMTIEQLPQKTKNYVNFKFMVEDNGIGMSKKFVKTIFTPFTREVSSLTNKVQGTGLGMAITYNLVNLMGGTIGVESEPQKGSKFTVELEFRIREHEIDQDFWKKHNATNMLVVDDETEVCEGVMKAMDGTGVTVKFALNGYTAVAMVSDADKAGDGFNIVLLDWKMPGIDGLETAKRIRKIVPEHIPIMILTAYDYSEIEEEAYLKSGINGFVSKPFFLSNFKRTIEGIMPEEQSEKEQAGSVFEGMNILAAEDNELNSEILEELLKMCGAKAEICEDGEKALKRFEKSAEGEFDLVLMDIQMPVMNGYEAAKAMRASKHPDALKIPIVAMTANAFAEDVKAALNAGMDAHVAKPVDMDILEEVIRNVLSEKKK